MKILILLICFFCVSYNAACQSYPGGFVDFVNIEQIDFCVPLPLSEYIALPSQQRAFHKFQHKTRPQFELSIQGMFKTMPSLPFKVYIEEKYKNGHLRAGEMIIEKGMNETTKCYFEVRAPKSAKRKMRMAEMIWVRSGDVVVLKVSYALKDSILWKNRLQFLIQESSICQ